MSDQISKLVTKDPALIQSIEIKQLITQVKDSEGRFSTKKNHPLKRKAISKQVAVPAEPLEEPDEQIMPPPVQAKKRTAEDPTAKANQAQQKKI
ncbi:Hypothetical predicted protein [Mytilus galloprovincialis]|uniref:Uncharacterized protein n=1 Tax=Mytilus galloprovincialis TaxID=29158 RepID=A0A8B6ERE3_MYTGA|nr:Hypothetical predicted protein [Mytilus galloprovincialis]